MEQPFDEQAAWVAGAAGALLGRLRRHEGDYADLFYEQTVHHHATLRQKGTRTGVGRPVEASRRQVVEGVGVRVLAADGVERLAAADGVEAAALEAAVAAVRAGAGAAPAVSLDPLRLAPEAADLPDAVAASEKAALLQRAADAALALHPDVCAVEVTYQDRVRRTLVATSEGRLCARVQPLVGLRVAVTLARGGRTVEAHAVGGAGEGFGHYFTQPPEELAREAVERVLARAAARPFAGGAMPVVVAGGWGGVWLHEAAGHRLEADVAEGLSLRAGAVLAPPFVTLVDDGTWPGGRATGTCDDEGTPSAATTLVCEGRLTALLTDRRRAAAQGAAPTGNGRRQDYRHAPQPRMTNLRLVPGTAAPGDLVADVAEGLFVACAGHGAARPDEDRFAFDVLEGYRIERGRRTAPVAGVRVEGRLSDVLARLAGVAADFRLDPGRGACRKAGQVVPVSVGTPTVLLHGLEVRSPGEG